MAKEKTGKKKTTPPKQKSNFLNWILILIIIVGVGWYFTNNKQGSTDKKETSQIAKDAKKVSSEKESALRQFISENKKDLFNTDKDIKVESVVEEDGLYKMMLDIAGDEVPFYLTEDDKLVFQVVTLDKVTKGEVKVLEGVELKKDKLVINDKVKGLVKDIIEGYLVQEGTKVEIGQIQEEDGLIKVEVSLQGQSQPIYFTKSGKQIALKVISFDEYKKEMLAQQEAQKKAAEVSADNKNDRPRVDVFVMSYCPYGTQIEKGLAPVIKLLGNKIDARLRFVNYAMHDKKELDENMAQYCIQKEAPDKIYNYLECFLEDGDSKRCLTKTNIDTEKLTSCVEATDKEFKVSENYKNKSTWKGQFPSFDIDKDDNEKYGVQGSPTLIINGQKIQPAGRDAQNLLNAICSGFKNQPEECKQKLSTTQPSSGFGSGASDSSGGGCGQ